MPMGHINKEKRTVSNDERSTTVKCDEVRQALHAKSQKMATKVNWAYWMIVLSAAAEICCPSVEGHRFWLNTDQSFMNTNSPVISIWLRPTHVKMLFSLFKLIGWSLVTNWAYDLSHFSKYSWSPKVTVIPQMINSYNISMWVTQKFTDRLANCYTTVANWIPFTVCLYLHWDISFEDLNLISYCGIYIPETEGSYCTQPNKNTDRTASIEHLKFKEKVNYISITEWVSKFICISFITA